MTPRTLVSSLQLSVRNPSGAILNHPVLPRIDAPVDLTDLKFENTFVRKLPADPVTTNVPRAVRNACYTRVEPTPVPEPRLLGWSDALGAMLGIARPVTS